MNITNNKPFSAIVDIMTGNCADVILDGLLPPKPDEGIVGEIVGDFPLRIHAQLDGVQKFFVGQQDALVRSLKKGLPTSEVAGIQRNLSQLMLTMKSFNPICNHLIYLCALQELPEMMEYCGGFGVRSLGKHKVCVVVTGDWVRLPQSALASSDHVLLKVPGKLQSIFNKKVIFDGEPKNIRHDGVKVGVLENEMVRQIVLLAEWLERQFELQCPKHIRDFMIQYFIDKSVVEYSLFGRLASEFKEQLGILYGMASFGLTEEVSASLIGSELRSQGLLQGDVTLGPKWSIVVAPHQ